MSRPTMILLAVICAACDTAGPPPEATHFGIALGGGYAHRELETTNTIPTVFGEQDVSVRRPGLA